MNFRNLNLNALAAKNGFKPAKQTAKPVAKPAPKVVPKVVTKTAKPQPEGNAPKLYGKAANGKVAGFMTLAVKWAANDRDPETRKVMTEIVKSVKKIVWDHLSDDKKKQLEKL